MYNAKQQTGKGACLLFLPNCFYFLLFNAELIFAYGAEGALEIVGEIFPLGAGRNAVFGRAFILVVFPTANIAYVSHVNSSV